MYDSSFQINNIYKTQILTEDKEFLIIYKPPRMHSAPLKKKLAEHDRTDNTLDHWSMSFPELKSLPAKREGEGGLLHRLDYETNGLLLFARTKKAMENLSAQQREGTFVKRYSALASKSDVMLPGFPEKIFPKADFPSQISSAFRPYGPGRKSVRPVTIDDSMNKKKEIALDNGELYRTEILGSKTIKAQSDIPELVQFDIKLYRGFRHQIRCHLAWLGMPIVNDSLYGGISFGNAYLALRAYSLSFTHPVTGEELCFSVEKVINFAL